MGTIICIMMISALSDGKPHAKTPDFHSVTEIVLSSVAVDNGNSRLFTTILTVVVVVVRGLCLEPLSRLGSRVGKFFGGLGLIPEYWRCPCSAESCTLGPFQMLPHGSLRFLQPRRHSIQLYGLSITSVGRRRLKNDLNS
ncbi:uncharacterized protein [Physcomitrium patens]|uniref:uncharacterized protein n=1 Tax=Physcomitrium patens TaxID=3218 RepID=UPI003CCDE2A4